MNSQVVILNEEQFADVIYKTVNRCLDEREVSAMVSKKKRKSIMVAMNCVVCCTSPFPPYGESSRKVFSNVRRSVERICTRSRRSTN